MWVPVHGPQLQATHMRRRLLAGVACQCASAANIDSAKRGTRADIQQPPIDAGHVHPIDGKSCAIIGPSDVSRGAYQLPRQLPCFK